MNPKQFAAKIRAAHPGAYDDISDEELTQKVLAKYPQYKDMVTMDAPKAPEPSFAERHPVISTAGDLAIGAAKGLGNTLNNVGSFLYPDALAKHITGVPTQQQKDRYFEPTNTAQKIGKTAEQVGEFLVPTGAEGAVVNKVAEFAPKIARYAVPAARVATDAVESGLRNKAQGGNFTTGAAIGGGTNVIGQAGKAVAPKVVEAALGIGKRVRGALPEGANVGRAVLDETTAVRPESIANQLSDKIAKYSQTVDDLADQAGKQGKTVPLSDARGIVRDEIGKAQTQNSATQLKNLNRLDDQLNVQLGPDGKPNLIAAPGPRTASGRTPIAAEPIAAEVSPSKARAMKQGIGMDVASWNPAEAKNITPTQERIYGSINRGFHNAVPAAEPLDRRMAELIPAYKSAAKVSDNGGLVEDISNRLERPTGALVGSAIGGLAGLQRGGVPGAVLGSVGSLVAPAAASLPASKMVLGRILDNPRILHNIVMPAIPITRSLTDEEQPTAQ